MSQLLRRKWTLRAHGKKVVFIKKSNERAEHVLMKAFLWALYLPQYPDLLVEVRIGDRYKPDIVSIDANTDPRFWGEAGQVGLAKIRSLIRRYPHTHFVLAKWDTNLAPYVKLVRESLEGIERTAPFELIRFPSNSVERFIDHHDRITIRTDDIERVVLE